MNIGANILHIDKKKKKKKKIQHSFRRVVGVSRKNRQMSRVKKERQAQSHFCPDIKRGFWLHATKRRVINQAFFCIYWIDTDFLKQSELLKLIM